ncbi:MAG TPA: hypothetical protein VK059_03225 [Nocardioidaceae bacterium]|nr:hypothetical protein [Nocardioidaceae bacterium]
MNDIPERPLSDQARARRKAELMNAIEARQKAGRWLVPAIAAAAVVAVVSVGAAVAVSGGDGPTGPAQSSGPGAATSGAKDNTGNAQGRKDGQKQQSGKIQKGDERWATMPARQCADLDVGIAGAKETHSIDVGDTTVRVYGNGDQYVTCDEWASNDGGPATLFAPREVGAPIAKNQFVISMNFGMKGGNEYVAGGLLPEGANAITYRFSNGDTEKAVVEDGAWAMAYFPDKALPDDATAKVTVTTESGSETFTLAGMDGFCGQVNHGC